MEIHTAEEDNRHLSIKYNIGFNINTDMYPCSSTVLKKKINLNKLDLKLLLLKALNNKTTTLYCKDGSMVFIPAQKWH